MADHMMTGRQPVDATLQRAVGACCLLISGLSLVYAEDFPDPTRPPASIFAPVAGAGRETTENQSSGLRTVIISATRRAAIIDGKTVELGEQHGDARLIEVNEGGVVLQRAQGRQVLALFPDVKITRKQTPEQQSVESQPAEKQFENNKSPNIESQVKRPSSKVQSRKHKHKSRPITRDEKSLMKPLAIPLGSQTTATKRLDMPEHPKEEK